MQQPDWDRIHEIYDEARKLPRAERPAFVEKASAGDASVARDVLDLLALDDESFMEPPMRVSLVPAADDLLGTTIKDRYFIEKELGEGGMSEVYLARDRTFNDRAVVMKFLGRDLLENSYARQKFTQESEALSRIHHAHVVQVWDKGELDGWPYFVMEFVEGETLRALITSEGMNLEQAATILRQVGAALEAAHQQGICHRDLKPENILLRHGTGDVVLIDFGIAKVTDSVAGPTTVHGQTAGTLMYMSPEQLRGESVTAASDIYSMAVIAYEVVTGRRPFNATSPARLAELQKKGVRIKPGRLREELSANAEAIMLRALSFDPGARHEHASEFGDSLADALSVRVAPKKKTWSKGIRVTLLIVMSVALIASGYKVIEWLCKREVINWCKIEPTRSFDYFLTVQPMHDEQPYGDPYRSHGEESYNKGDKFRLTISTPVPAFLYVFNEGRKQNETSFKMLYPRQATKGAASLGADQSFETEWMTFSDPEVAENFWIVWSTSPVPELESINSEQFKNADGSLTGDTLVAVKQYLMAKKAEIHATTYNYNANKTAVVRAKRDLIVVLAQFKPTKKFLSR